MSKSQHQAALGMRSWLSNRELFWLAGLLAVIVLALGVLFVVFEQNELRASQIAQVEQYAKLLEHQTSADIATIETTAHSMSELVEAMADNYNPDQLGGLLADSVRGNPQLRSVSVLDQHGRVLASSTASNVDAKINLQLLGTLPNADSKSVLGPILSGRDLTDLKHRAPGALRLNVMPLLFHRDTAAGQSLTLVALVNADYFSAKHELLLDNPTLRMALVDYKGELLVATTNVVLELGSSLRHLSIFKDFLPTRESGHYIGLGLDGARVITSFRSTRQWPLLVLVEQSFDVAMSEAVALEKWTAGAVLTAWLMIVILTIFTSRSLRRHNTLIGQLQEANQAVFASDARNMAVLESSVDAVITIDGAGCIIAFNPAAERMFDRDRSDVLGKPMHDLVVPPHLRKAHQDGMKNYFATGHGAFLNRRVEIVAMRRDESIFPIELTIVPAHVNDEVFFTAHLRDISEQRKAAQERAAMLSQYRELAIDLERQKMALDQHAIVSITDANEAIIYANDKLVQISGFSREELIGRKYYEFRKQLNPVVYAEVRAALAAGKIWHGELVMRRRDGGSYWASSTSVPVPGHDGRPRQWINIETDISDLRQAEIALNQARSRETEIGNRIQQSLLAANPTQQMPGLWLTCYNQASKGIDGDFVDVIRIGEHCVDLLAGDVMGKGVPAALMGAATKLQFSRSIAELLAFSNRAGEPPQPAAIVASVHQAMTSHLQALDAFVTLVYLRIDTRRNVITWVGCGHEETSVIHGGTGGFRLLSNQHPPLGVLDSSEFTQEEVPLSIGDAVFVCSDGLTDAMRPDGERVGRDLLNVTVQQVLRDHSAPAAALHSLRRQVLYEGVQLNDDVTMVLIMRIPVQTHETRCELPIALDSLREFREFVAAQAFHAGLPEQDSAIFVVASVEVFTNIIRHAKGLLPGAPVELIVRATPQEFVLEVVHLGDAFTPPEEPKEADLSSFPEGGFGLTIIRSSCDRVEFLHHAGVNTVRMTRRMEPLS